MAKPDKPVNRAKDHTVKEKARKERAERRMAKAQAKAARSAVKKQKTEKAPAAIRVTLNEGTQVFHIDTCRYVKDEYTPMTLNRALKAGHKPCRTCLKGVEALQKEMCEMHNRDYKVAEVATAITHAHSLRAGSFTLNKLNQPCVYGLPTRQDLDNAFVATCPKVRYYRSRNGGGAWKAQFKAAWAIYAQDWLAQAKAEAEAAKAKREAEAQARQEAFKARQAKAQERKQKQDLLLSYPWLKDSHFWQQPTEAKLFGLHTPKVRQASKPKVEVQAEQQAPESEIHEAVTRSVDLTPEQAREIAQGLLYAEAQAHKRQQRRKENAGKGGGKCESLKASKKQKKRWQAGEKRAAKVLARRQRKALLSKVVLVKVVETKTVEMIAPWTQEEFALKRSLLSSTTRIQALVPQAKAKAKDADRKVAELVRNIANVERNRAEQEKEMEYNSKRAEKYSDLVAKLQAETKVKDQQKHDELIASAQSEVMGCEKEMDKISKKIKSVETEISKLKLAHEAAVNAAAKAWEPINSGALDKEVFAKLADVRVKVKALYDRPTVTKEITVVRMVTKEVFKALQVARKEAITVNLGVMSESSVANSDAVRNTVTAKRQGVDSHITVPVGRWSNDLVTRPVVDYNPNVKNVAAKA